MKGFGIYVKNDLLEPKHRKAMGTAIWEYLWCLDKMTSITEEGIGRVLGGRPIKLREIKKDIGITEKSISCNINKLEKAGYLKLTHAPYGVIIYIIKAKKKFGRKFRENLDSLMDSFEAGRRYNKGKNTINNIREVLRKGNEV